MAKGKWQLENHEKEKYLELFKRYLYTLEKKEDIDEIDLTNLDINPYQTRLILEELGYAYDTMDENGWEQDCWIYMKKEGYIPLVIYTCGMTYELKLSVDWIEVE